MVGGCSKCAVGHLARKGVYVCNCRSSTQVCRSCVEFWGKKCPFCGREMILIPDAVFTKPDRDETPEACKPIDT